MTPTLFFPSTVHCCNIVSCCCTTPCQLIQTSVITFRFAQVIIQSSIQWSFHGRIGGAAGTILPNKFKPEFRSVPLETICRIKRLLDKQIPHGNVKSDSISIIS